MLGHPRISWSARQLQRLVRHRTVAIGASEDMYLQVSCSQRYLISGHLNGERRELMDVR
jgi:hypothetical protein